MRTQQIVIVPHHHALRFGIGGDDVERLSGRDPQSAPLPDREMNDALMCADGSAIQIDSDSVQVPRGGWVSVWPSFRV